MAANYKCSNEELKTVICVQSACIYLNFQPLLEDLLRCGFGLVDPYAPTFIPAFGHAQVEVADHKIPLAPQVLQALYVQGLLS